jgi:hypothetical protein
MKVQTKIPWTENISKIENQIVKRILENFYPTAIIDNTIFLKYQGEENKKSIVGKYYKEHFLEIKQELVVLFGVSVIKFTKQVDLKEENLFYLENLINKFQPSGIKFQI